jgi:hypothetical protein
MIKLRVNEFNTFFRLLEDEVERHKFWLDNKDFISEEERKSIEQDLSSLSSMLQEMQFKKERLLTLLR